MAIDARNRENAARARELYLDNLRPAEAAADWQFALQAAKKCAGDALQASGYLSGIAAALMASGAHTLVFRQMLAPPLSQDQFKLVCPQWRKAAENTGAGLASSTAQSVADTILARLDRRLVTWTPGDTPTGTELEQLLRVISTLIAVQKVATSRRSRVALDQESAVVAMLEGDGWVRLPSKLIDTRAAVPPRSFMRKTRFATATTAHQEVDIACGLERSYVLAMECKVTNDETNSVKRINDILKKAAAWKSHWGSFVLTAALLQGVVSAKDVQRLSDAGVLVFWSHSLDEFKDWLKRHMGSET